MKTTIERFSIAEGSSTADLLRGTLLFIWRTVRVPIVIVLAFLEPFVRFALIGIAVLSVITAFVYKGSSIAAPIPFWQTLCVSLVCVLLLAVYHGVLRLLSR